MDPIIQQAITAAVNSAVTSAIITAFAEFQIKHDVDIQSLRSIIRNSSAGEQLTPSAGKQSTSSAASSLSYPRTALKQLEE